MLPLDSPAQRGVAIEYAAHVANCATQRGDRVGHHPVASPKFLFGSWIAAPQVAPERGRRSRVLAAAFIIPSVRLPYLSYL